MKKCPELIELSDFAVLFCSAMEHPHLPNFFQLSGYCKNKNYDKCPLYSKTEEKAVGNPC